MKTVALKAYLQDLVAEAQIDKALDAILKWARTNDDDLANDTLLLMSRYKSLQKQLTSGLIGNNEANITSARITNSLNTYIAKLPLDAVIEIAGTNGQASSATPRNLIPPIVKTTDKLKILMLTANPAGTTAVNLDKEHSRIAEKLQNQPDKFLLTVKKAINRTEFKEYTEIVQPFILHFSGHGVQGAEYGGIVVQNEDKNGYQLMSPDALEALFEYFKEEFAINVVLLNACYSEEQAIAIAKYVPYVIGTTKSIQDDYAIAFSVGFYFKLAESGLDFLKAYKSGRIEARGAGAAKTDFVLYQNGVKVDV